MKRILKSLLLTLVLSTIICANDTYDVYLSNNVVYKGWDFQKIVNNEVYIKKSVNNLNGVSIKVEHFPVQSIIKIHPRRHPRSVIFGGIGFAVGAILNSGGSSTDVISGPSAMLLMGLMVGSIPAGVGLLFDIAYWTSPRSRKIDLSQMTLEEKVNFIQTIISTRQS